MNFGLMIDNSYYLYSFQLGINTNTTVRENNNAPTYAKKSTGNHFSWSYALLDSINNTLHRVYNGYTNELVSLSFPRFCYYFISGN